MHHCIDKINFFFSSSIIFNFGVLGVMESCPTGNGPATHPCHALTFVPSHPSSTIHRQRTSCVTVSSDPSYAGSDLPFHSLGSFVCIGCNHAQLLPQLSYILNRSSHVVGQCLCNLLADQTSQLRAIPVRADHNLQRAIPVDTAKVEVAFRWDICDVCWDPSLLAQLPDLRRGFRVVNGAEHHVGIVQVAWLEGTVDIRHLLLGDSKGHLLVQSG